MITIKEEPEKLDPDKDFILDLESEDFRIIILRAYQGRPCGCGSKDKHILIMKNDVEKMKLFKQLLELEDETI